MRNVAHETENSLRSNIVAIRGRHITQPHRPYICLGIADSARGRNYSDTEFSVFNFLVYLRVSRAGKNLESKYLPASAMQSRSMPNYVESEDHALSAREALCFLFPALPCFLEFRSFNSAGSMSFSNAVIVCSFLPVRCLLPCSLYW